MITKIGIVAGEIWDFLDKNTQATLSRIASEIDHPNDLLLMSIGWLAREGHVVLEQHENDYKIVLRKDKV